MSFGLFRTVWITLRAANYTTRAFNDTIAGLSKMQREQIKFRMNAAKNIMGVGIMYAAFGLIAVMTLSKIIAASKLGQRVMENFGSRVGKQMEKLGDTLARILGPILNVIASLLEMAFAIPFFKEFAAVILILGTGFLFIKAATMVLGSVITMLGIQHSVTAGATALHGQALLTQYIPATATATAVTYSLGQSLLFVGAAFGAAFGAVFMIYQLFGKMPAIIVGVVIALVALLVILLAILTPLTLGKAAMFALAGAAAGGAIGAGAVAMMPEYQMGTSFVRQGGLAMVHGGEEITSARESSSQARWQTTQEFKKTMWNVNIHMGDVHTKADEETMIPMLRRALKEELDNKY